MTLSEIKRALHEYHATVKSKSSLDATRKKRLRDIEICLECAMDHILTAQEFQARIGVSDANDQDKESQ